jgi:hypothetical protein
MSGNPSTKSLVGNLGHSEMQITSADAFRTHLATSSFTRLASSSLYKSATLPVYFFLVSDSVKRVEPPFLEKKSVADPFPPTFIVRS